MNVKNICVIGLGYIGLPTAAIFASRKIQVYGVDVNEEAVNTINQGKIHIIEPELDAIVFKAVQQGYLHASTEAQAADAFLIAVPTPFKESDDPDSIPEPDLHFIHQAAETIAPVLDKGNLVILESTSPVGTTELLAQWLKEMRPDLSFPQDGADEIDINVAHCPERVLPGKVVRELVHNDRLIGGITPECSEKSVELYKIFVDGECIVTNARTAEMAKLTENASRDVSIAFANELSIICEQLDINVWELIRLANRHPRVNILQPGPGVGGHCIAVDPWFIVSKCPEQAKMISLARGINNSKPDWVIGQYLKAVDTLLSNEPSKTVKDLCVACLGIAFKADIDDLRESPALDITNKIAEMHEGQLLVVEPNISTLPSPLNEKAKLSTLNDAMIEADIVVLLVDHKAFKRFDIKKVNIPQIIDSRGLWSE
ncbi:UDP-N-acetyl-D-mannosamine dehydrogenase [Psychrobium sp. 1_MG-2023]|uniref:UDP-N-acetyl-D-mannosamine dehydrogenase n=1 Tax=Psychrobium sp. 1_MG-2023 TaxID=3062624 RepID=UPI000C330D91|nr:UDP-N-acetyl-D-mannosamine dehydrogenase [Psychrobium sp. 1_MG-2023]MDP2562077.1 UDP-N-acetyl-D-mannosamine dehydrogenase [Psychrobium sp. 1_MG-2023]PKF55678.1 UDP-N-acetyl-D-mannosamine dehydrogenase [Alteromonadales bacterium alter-6D02]